MPTMARMTRTASGILSQTSDVMIPPVESAGSGSADTGSMPLGVLRALGRTSADPMKCGDWRSAEIGARNGRLSPLRATKDKVMPHLWLLATTRSPPSAGRPGDHAAEPDHEEDRGGQRGDSQADRLACARAAL